MRTKQKPHIHTQRSPKVMAALIASANHYGVTVDDIIARFRTHRISLARHVAIFVAKKMCDYNYGELAAEFERDRSLMYNSIELVKHRIMTDIRFATEVDKIIKAARAFKPNGR